MLIWIEIFFGDAFETPAFACFGVAGEFETRSLPCSLAATLAALPSTSLIPSARFTNSH